MKKNDAKKIVLPQMLRIWTEHARNDDVLVKMEVHFILHIRNRLSIALNKRKGLGNFKFQNLVNQKIK